MLWKGKRNAPGKVMEESRIHSSFRGCKNVLSKVPEGAASFPWLLWWGREDDGFLPPPLEPSWASIMALKQSSFHRWVIKWKWETMIIIYFCSLPAWMCAEIFPNPANVLILHYCFPAGGVEKGPSAGRQETCVSALPPMDWAIWDIHSTFLSFIFFLFRETTSRLCGPLCHLLLVIHSGFLRPLVSLRSCLWHFGSNVDAGIVVPEPSLVI